MATIRLVPSEYYLSSTSYLSVSNAANMYANTDSGTYATVTNSRSATTSYYIYLRGFNFDDIPSGAIINNFTIKVKANYSGGYSQNIYLFNGTSQSLGDSGSSPMSSTVTTHVISTTYSWEDIAACGAELGVRINCRRASRNTTAYIYIYGAEIEVDYTVPDPATVTSTLTGNGIISPAGVVSTFKDAEYTLIITPDDKSEQVKVTNNGTDVSDQLVEHGSEHNASAIPADVTTSGIQSGASYAEYAVGHSAESPSTSGTSSNMYASSNSTGYAEYSFDFSAIPSNATIEAVEVRCYGHRESSTISSTYVSQCRLYRGSTAISDAVDFPHTSNTLITVTPTTVPTRSELDDVTVRHFVGYYGGLVLGITFVVTYSTGSGLDQYTYTFTVTGDAVIAVVIGGSGEQDAMFIRQNGSWKKVQKVFKKIGGQWIEQTDLKTVFGSGTDYLKGGN